MMAWNGKTQGAVADNHPPRAVNPSAFGTVEGACADVGTVASRVVSMVDRLCGLAPEAGSIDPNKRSEPNGLLDAASRQALDIRENVMRINAAMDRLESLLP